MAGELAELERPAGALPVDWRQTTLGGALAKSEGGGTPTRDVEAYWNGDIPWASVKDVVKGEGSTPEETITSAGLANSTSKLIPAGTNIFAARMGVGAVVRYPFPVAINQDLMALTPSSALDPGYLFYWLQAQKEAFIAVATGTTVKGIRKDVLLSFPMVLPPLDEQRRIAEVLRWVDEAIAANKAVAVQSRRTYRSALTELVGSGLDHWETVCLGQIATFVNGRGFKPHEWGDVGYPIIRIQNLNGGTDFNYYSGDFNPKILVRPGDLLFAWSGSRGTSFGPHIWRGPEGVLNYHTWKVVPVAPEDCDYLYFALRHLTKKIEDEAHGASALVHMQKAYVVDYEIQLPPPEERNAIAATLIDLQEAVNHAEEVYREAGAMKGHLISDLLSGRVRVPA